MTIKLAGADLDYLLQQANILNDYSRLTSALDPNGVREVSGYNNNLAGGYTVGADGTIVWTGGNVHPDWGQADTEFLRMFTTNHPTEPEYGTSYATVQKMWVTLVLPDSEGRLPDDPDYVATSKQVLVDNPMSMSPSMFVADGAGNLPGDPDYTPTVDAMSMMVAMSDAQAEYQFGTDGSTLDILNSSVVVDSTPRLISELITSSNVDMTDPNYNPAAVAAMNNLGGEAVDVSNSVVGDITTAFMPNPGILGGVTYNEWFVAFGQFFDHGLDFIQKTGGVVMIPLSENDPLWIDPADPAYIPGVSNVMMLSRAKLSNPDTDFDENGNLLPGVTPLYNNNTGLMIDQSQTYGSHEAVNVLLRQYDADGTVTGALITGAEDGIVHRPDANGTLVALDVSMGAAMAPDGTMVDGKDELATWADMKVNATRIGIELVDTDVLDCPWINADAIGRLNYTPQSDFLFRSDQSIADLEAIATTTGIEIGGVTYTSFADLAAAGYDPYVRWTLQDAMEGKCAAADIGEVRTTNQAVLLDIAHGASPGADFQGNELDPASDPNAGAFTYDDALLARHKVSGDGRVNENITLTSVHHVFHEEHNIQARNVMMSAVRDAIASGDIDGLNGTDAANEGWLAVDIDQITFDSWAGTDLTDDAAVQAIVDSLTWDGERVYQAARIITESEYNHIAVDQYMGTLYPALPEFVSYSADINLNISLEFSQAVFRLGHSQLRETVQIAVTDEAGVNPGEPGYVPTYVEKGLFDVFLNPDQFDVYGASGIAAGLLTQQGNEMDEFVTAALQQSLVGVPLDLPALNIARGRDVGLPTLNELRMEVFDGLTQNTSNNTNGSGIAPYHSWEDFGAHLRTPESLVNFIAAYGRDEDGTFGLQAARDAYQAGTGELYEIRAAAQAILDAAADASDPMHDAALMFMRGSGEPTYTPGVGWSLSGGQGDQGFWDIDLWVGGLAEQAMFDGPLGTTFSFIMLDFTQRLQDGDRFYYLYRMPVGHHLGDQIIGEQFAHLIMRTTGLEHIPDAFATPSATYVLDGTTSSGDYHDNARDGLLGVDDAYGDNDYFNATLERLPDEVRQIDVGNGSFEDQLLGGGVGTTNTNGTYLNGAPQGWQLTNGGTWAPETEVLPADPNPPVDGAMLTGDQVAYMGNGAILSKTVETPLVEDATYTLTFDVIDRLDRVATGGEAKLFDSDGNLLGSVIFDPPTENGGKVTVTLVSDPIPAGSAGLDLRIVIEKFDLAGSTDQILIDNVQLTETVPGGPANDGHITVIGLSGDDFIVGALGDDVLYGDEGNDRIEGAQGNDHIYGGDGDDYITDYENDDFILGGNGNDTIFAGPGVLDTSHGNAGDDEVHGGDGIDEVFGDDGNDRLYGEGDTDLMMGGDGNDYMDGGDSVDEMFGGNGADWMVGGVGDDNINGGSGNDLLEGGLGPTANDGDRLNGDSPAQLNPVIEFNGDGTEGDMDIGSYEDAYINVVANLQTSNNAGTGSVLMDQYAFLEGLVGSQYNDDLTGADENGIGSNGANNYLVGGGGDDRLTGLGDGGDESTGQADFIFGDAVIVDADLYWIGDNRHDQTVTVTGFIEDWYGTGDTRVQFSDGSLGHILGDTGAEGTDTALYTGNRDDYRIELISMNGQQAVKITDLRNGTDNQGNPVATDGVDILVGVEWAEFANGETISLNPDPMSDIMMNATGRTDGTLARLSADVPFGGQASYELLSGTPDIRLRGANDDQLRVAGGLGDNETHSATIRATDASGTQVTETFDIVTGDAGDNMIDLSAATNDTTVYGREGNDSITGGSGNDSFVWTVTNQRRNQPERPDGRDFVDGGTNGTAGDRFVVSGNNTRETFAIYTIAAAALAGITAENAAAEIIITRDGEVIAELANIEEITINTLDVTADNGNGGLDGGNTGGRRGDFVEILGDFSGTSLAYSTITINGDGADDTVDISGLTSDHRIVFNGGGGDDVVVGGERPQDVLNGARHGTRSDSSDQDSPDSDSDAGTDSAMPDGLVLVGDDTAETFIGMEGNDVIFAGGGADNALGNEGDDMIFGDGGADRLFGGEGDDVIEAGKGRDMVFADDGDDTVIATEDDGVDSYWGGEGSDTLDYAAIQASVEVDLGHGTNGHGQVMIGETADQIYSFENVITGSGDDTIIANSAVNVMDGGGGHDTFVFNAAADADGDRINGFAPGDKIDLSGIDADQGAAGAQSFVLFAAGDFSAAGELRVSYEMRDDGEHTIVAGNVDDDLEADFEIDIAGRHILDASDFNGVN
ncbi:Ca2+-binding RTX toxin-like protein [Thioclava sp. ES.031]|uniref:peroxidase family protein n=1 Tax=Thioclava sp. ES.031 TaxID=1798203 RepID=UPI000BF2ADAF|nr:peroxidase family protein [Thioclava sp. ES.031]PFG63103.1 Ca2+-binding RTX toxin-like protein [Thioclava sp. ES.031]